MSYQQDFVNAFQAVHGRAPTSQEIQSGLSDNSLWNNIDRGWGVSSGAPGPSAQVGGGWGLFGANDQAVTRALTNHMNGQSVNAGLSPATPAAPQIAPPTPVTPKPVDITQNPLYQGLFGPNGTVSQIKAEQNPYTSQSLAQQRALAQAQMAPQQHQMMAQLAARGMLGGGAQTAATNNLLASENNYLANLKQQNKINAANFDLNKQSQLAALLGQGLGMSNSTALANSGRDIGAQQFNSGQLNGNQLAQSGYDWQASLLPLQNYWKNIGLQQQQQQQQAALLAALLGAGGQAAGAALGA